MSKAEDTRNYIIEKSASVFNIKGYGGTSLSDIMKATGLTKGAIYGNFENKDEVAIEVYKYNILAMKRRFVEVMQPETTATGKLIAFTEFYRINWKWFFEKGGCPIQNASIEADDNAPFLKKHVQQSIKDWVKAIGSIIEYGQQGGEFTKKIDAQAYAYTILTTLEGGVMLSEDHEQPTIIIYCA